jgi:hypothetical protein
MVEAVLFFINIESRQRTAPKEAYKAIPEITVAIYLLVIILLTWPELNKAINWNCKKTAADIDDETIAFDK